MSSWPLVTVGTSHPFGKALYYGPVIPETACHAYVIPHAMVYAMVYVIACHSICRDVLIDLPCPLASALDPPSSVSSLCLVSDSISCFKIADPIYIYMYIYGAFAVRA